jgi:phospholipid/cholesterol/gamma-HCH transport system substrate-binding protein
VRAARLGAVGVLAIAGAVTALILLGAGSNAYVIHARFANAGQLVKGGSVQVAGREVGNIAAVDLAPNGQADVKLSIDDDGITPLREGTRAAIRTVGQAGVANRFVDLSPGPSSAPALADGAVLPSTQTSGIVDLDAILDSFDPAARANMRRLIANSSQVFAGSGARYFNGMLGKLDPALAELSGLSGELADDHAALRRLIGTGATAASAIASRRTDLQSAVANTARSFRAVAGERAALADVIGRAPRVLTQATGTLAHVDTAITALRPALRDVPPVARPLNTFLRRLTPTLHTSRPVVAELRGQLPGLRSTLAGLPALERRAVPALNALGSASKTSRHILRGLRFYGSDLFLGIVNGLGVLAASNYDATGRYGRLSYIQSPKTLVAGGLSQLLKSFANVPGLFDARTKQLRPCPGGNAPPAPDGSNPWIPDPSLCTPEHDIQASVNEP